MDIKNYIILLLLCFFCTTPLFAETIVLKSGTTIEGTIMEENKDYIKIDIHGVPVTYYLDDIKSIDGKDVVNIGISSNDPNVLVSFWETAIKDDPNNYNAHNALGMAYSQLGEFQKALNCFEKAIKIRPGYSVAYGYAGATYNSLKQPEKAIPYLKKAIELGSQDIIVYNSLGGSYLFSGQYAEAIPYFEKVIATNPENIKTLIALGLSYKSNGQIDRAKESFLKAKEVAHKQGDDKTAEAVEEQYIKSLEQ